MLRYIMPGMSNNREIQKEIRDCIGLSKVQLAK